MSRFTDGEQESLARVIFEAQQRHDMSADYCRLARWRTTDRGQLASALEVEKPAPVMDGQAELFEEWTA